MSQQPKQLTNITLGFALLALLIYASYKSLAFLWEVFSHVNPTVGAGIIAASATVIVSVISVLVAKRLEYRAALLKEHREKKTPFYEEMVKFIFRIAFSEKLGMDPLTDKEMIEKLAQFTESLVVWGSDEVIDAWFRFRNRSINGIDSPTAVLFEVESILLAIRQDLGHSNKGITKGKLLGLFVNDIHEWIKV